MYNKDSTKRFSSRVSDYIRYRPHYPVEIISFLKEKYSIPQDSVIADIGAGTGISSKLFLDNDYTVIAIEPNAEMRNAAVAWLQRFEKFSVSAGTAENTLLPGNSIDIIVAAQAFHWFDAAAVRKEFKRVLKPGGLVVLIWNERLTGTDFEKEYDQLILKYAIDYVQIDHRNIDLESINKFFAPNPCELKIFPNYQDFDFDGLKGRLLSSSYIPRQEDKDYPEMIVALQELFNKYQQNGAVRVNYATKVYAGTLFQ